MKRLIGLAGSTLLVALTTYFTTAAPASANAHFEPAAVGFKTTSGTTVFYANGVASIRCTSDTGKGGLTSLEGLSWVSLIFERCSSVVRCISSGLGFEALSGELGLVAASEATSELGVVLKFNTIVECGTEKLELKGTVAGEFTPLASGLAHNLNFFVLRGEQKIKTIAIRGTAIKPKLEISLNGSRLAVAALESEESNTFKNAIEGVL